MTPPKLWYQNIIKINGRLCQTIIIFFASCTCYNKFGEYMRVDYLINKMILELDFAKVSIVDDSSNSLDNQNNTSL